MQGKHKFTICINAADVELAEGRWSECRCAGRRGGALLKNAEYVSGHGCTADSQKRNHLLVQTRHANNEKCSL